MHAGGQAIFSRDAVGRVRRVTVGLGQSQSYQAATWYGPLGAVVAAENATWQWAPDQGQQLGGLERFRVDPLGNRLWQGRYDVNIHEPDSDGERDLSIDGDGRLTRILAPFKPLQPWFRSDQRFEYDLAGNNDLSYSERTVGESVGGSVVTEQTASYYDASNRLTVVNRHLGLIPQSNPGGVYEEYRYDALGRRVLVRSRGTYAVGAQQGTGGPWSYVERTVWDGSRVLAEVRGNGSRGATHEMLENDSPASGITGTEHPYGRVRYVHALGLAATDGMDLPLLVERSGVGSGAGSGGVIRFAPLTNWRGVVQAGVVTPGSATLPVVGWPGARLTLEGHRSGRRASRTCGWVAFLASYRTGPGCSIVVTGIWSGYGRVHAPGPDRARRWPDPPGEVSRYAADRVRGVCCTRLLCSERRDNSTVTGRSAPASFGLSSAHAMHALPCPEAARVVYRDSATRRRSPRRRRNQWRNTSSSSRRLRTRPGRIRTSG